MTSIARQAEKDAREWTQAKLAYGEGAGTRRKLINETVAYKMEHIDGYKHAFDKAAAQQDVAAMARNAKRDNRRKTVNEALARNTRAAVTGKYENLNTALLIAGGAAVVLHKTGLDKVIVEKTKARYRDLRRRMRRTTMPKPAPKRGDDKVWKITSI